MKTLKATNRKKRIGVIAHESRKIELINWSYTNKRVLGEQEIYAAGVTADILGGTTGGAVNRLDEAQLGSEQQFIKLIHQEKLDMMIFFFDSLKKNRKEADIKLVLEKAAASGIIVGTNQSTADLMLASIPPAREAFLKIHDAQGQEIIHGEMEVSNQFGYAKMLPYVIHRHG